VLLQFAAVAYSRAGGSTHPAARYGDISSLGLAAWIPLPGLRDDRLARDDTAKRDRPG
jgi:hypothetical protein